MAVKKGEGTHEVVWSRVTMPRWGENITGWLTRPQVRPAPALLVSPDAWGITGFVEIFCHRLSRQGYACLAVEPYSRGGRPRRSQSLEVAREAFAALPPARWVGDLRAGLDFLRKSGDAEIDQVGVLAFGEGGLGALEIASQPALAMRCLALLYASLPVAEDAGRRLTCPVLGLYGGKDDVVPPDRARAFAAAAAAGGIRAEMLVYPDAPHAFVDDEREWFDPASTDDAWTRLLAFLERTLRA